jgi:hypothetical protein
VMAATAHSSSQELQWQFKFGQRSLGGGCMAEAGTVADGAVALGAAAVGAGAASALASAPACFLLLRLCSLLRRLRLPLLLRLRPCLRLWPLWLRYRRTYYGNGGCTRAIGTQALTIVVITLGMVVYHPNRGYAYR